MYVKMINEYTHSTFLSDIFQKTYTSNVTHKFSSKLMQTANSRQNQKPITTRE